MLHQLSHDRFTLRIQSYKVKIPSGLEGRIARKNPLLSALAFDLGVECRYESL